MKKKAGILLCVTGVVLVILAVVMLLNVPSHQDEQATANEDITEVTQEIGDGEENSTTTEYQETVKQETSEGQAASNTDSKLQASTEQSAHDINSEVYEWPCGRKYFQYIQEPQQVLEFAKYKEYYDQIAQEFLEYEGKDIYFYANEDGVYFDECKNEGSIKVNYDKELLLNLFEKSKIRSIKVRSDYIVFNTNVSDGEKIMYLYDETLTYNDSFPSEKDSLISGYWMVNIAPHWWWKDSDSGK